MVKNIKKKNNENMGRKPLEDRRVEIRLWVKRSDIERHTGATIKNIEDEKIAALAMREFLLKIISPTEIL